MTYHRTLHCVKSVRIRSYSGPELFRTRITPNTNSFHAVLIEAFKIAPKLRLFHNF